MNTRTTFSRLLPLSLTLGLLATACDGDSKPADKKAAKETKADKADANAEPKPEVKLADAAEAKPAGAVEAKPADAAEAKPADAVEAKPADAAEAKPEGSADETAEPEEVAKADAKPKGDKPKAEPKPKADKPKAEPAPSGVDGKALYLKKCKNCHGTTGAADTKLATKHDIPSWKESGWKGKWSMSKIKDIVSNGKSGTKMKAFKGKLTPEEIDAVSTYSRGLGK
ncbi:MAG: c-type cytochrome [Nannocystales bacterium]